MDKNSFIYNLSMGYWFCVDVNLQKFFGGIVNNSYLWT